MTSGGKPLLVRWLGAALDYVLVFNPVGARAHYMKLRAAHMHSTGLRLVADMIWSTTVRSGYDIARLKLEKFYNVHLKLLRHLVGMRYLAERLAPSYVVELPQPYAAAHVDLDTGGLTVVLGDLAHAEGEAVLRLVPLFKDPARLEDFLAMQSVFSDALVETYAAMSRRMGEYARTLASLVEAVNSVSRTLVEALPGCYDIIESVLERYNVTGRSVVNFAVEEAVARQLIAELQRRLQPAEQAAAPAAAKPAAAGKAGQAGG